MATDQHDSSYFSTFPGERKIREYEVVDRPRKITLADIITCLLLLCLYVVPGLIYALLVYLFRDAEKGYLVLTDQRLCYYGTTRNVLGEKHIVFQVQLEHVVGVTSAYQKSLGQESVAIAVLTSYSDGFTTAAARGNPIVPFLAPWMPTSIGKDVYLAARELYGLLDAVRTGKEVA